MQKKLKYDSYDIVFQEVPNEITLVFNITGCPHKCEGCHSKYLWKNHGNFVSDDIKNLINKYKGMITCVCFMGGDQNINELNQLLILTRQEKLKTCVYSGLDTVDVFDLQLLDYLKIGSYNQDLGGLNCKTTNQKMYKIVNGGIEDITYKFQESTINMPRR